MKTNLNVIWAEDLDGGIGYQGKLPWHLSADMKNFKKLTTGHAVIMGANTMKSLRKPLPNRHNLVLSHHHIDKNGWLGFQTIQELANWLNNDPDEKPFVIGGAKIYQELLPFADQLFRTVVLEHYQTDTKMPPIDYDQWQLVKSRTILAKDSQPGARFEVWHRKD